MSNNAQTDRLIELIGCYQKFFRSPFPSAVIRAMSEGFISVDEICARIEAALATARADEEWERMVPAEGTIDYQFCYLPMLKQLLRE